PELGRANAWFGVGDIDDAQFTALVRDKGITAAAGLVKVIREAAEAAGHDPHALPGGYTVRTSAGVAARLAADPLQRSAQRLFWAAVVAAAGFALLAVLLTLFRAAPERGAMLARLRTLGLRPRQGLALILAEALPQTLAAALGGALVAFAAVGLLGPAFDLSALVGVHVGEQLTPALLPVLLPTAGLALVVCAGVVAETVVSGRRQLAAELRAGDQR
ncbi:FtsX-like permease family protein, partial [Kitasatospora sp. NPDC093558]|uniref:FtsX-like permease family protein n=1 Tax=Kitasatospora sp. NPDC093558 TaxID=3155201 RepID=UPI003420B71E